MRSLYPQNSDAGRKKRSARFLCNETLRTVLSSNERGGWRPHGWRHWRALSNQRGRMHGWRYWRALSNQHGRMHGWRYWRALSNQHGRMHGWRYWRALSNQHGRMHGRGYRCTFCDVNFIVKIDDDAERRYYQRGEN